MTDEKEFRSRLEDLVDEVKELRFPSSAGFKPFQHLFSEESVSHPAKANLYMIYYLINKYTKEGETVADVMAGSGSTGIVASYLGRHAILVELERKFVDWIKENVELLESRGKRKGEIQVIQGDARRLTELLGVKADSIVTSPPYAETTMEKKFKTPEELEKFAKEQWVFKHGRSLEATKRFIEKSWKGYPEDKDNIGNLPLGEIDTVLTSPPYRENEKNLPLGEVDAIVTSPPYSASAKGSDRKEFWERLADDPMSSRFGRQNHPHTAEGYSESKGNIGNLPHGEIDAIVTSPPYSESMSKKRKGHSVYPNLERTREMPQETRDDNIANLYHGDIDAILTSPPYEGSLEGTTRHTRGGIASRDPALAQTGTYATTLSEATKQGVPVGYSPSKDNIGSLKSSREEYNALEGGCDRDENEKGKAKGS